LSQGLVEICELIMPFSIVTILVYSVILDNADLLICNGQVILTGVISLSLYFRFFEEAFRL